MFCQKCGNELPDSATLCTSCGWKSQNWEIQKQKGKARHSSIVTACIATIVSFVFLIALVIVAVCVGGN